MQWSLCVILCQCVPESAINWKIWSLTRIQFTEGGYFSLFLQRSTKNGRILVFPESPFFSIFLHFLSSFLSRTNFCHFLTFPVFSRNSKQKHNNGEEEISEREGKINWKKPTCNTINLLAMKINLLITICLDLVRSSTSSAKYYLCWRQQ